LFLYLIRCQLQFFRFVVQLTVIITFAIAYTLILLGIILAAYNFSNTPKFALFFIIAISAVVIGITILFIHIQFGHLSNEFQNISVKSGYAIMLTLLTLGLSIRMKMQRERSYMQMLEDVRELKDKEAKINQKLEADVKERTKLLLENKTQLEEANTAIKKQNQELELAFKKSSHQHVKLQKALRMINEHKDSLEKAFKKSSSQHVKLQKALRLINQQKAELEIANKEIKESSKLKEIFLANTSHEIRTPLNAIVGFTNLLLKTSTNPEQLKYVKNIKSSGDNLLIIINDILDFSKIEAGKLSFETIPFNIYELTEQLFETLRVKANQKGVLLESNIDAHLPDTLVGDPYRLNQILINLLGNSIKFTNKGGKISLGIEVTKKENNDLDIGFKVADTGIGISKEKLKTIFTSFTQAESNTTRKYGGTGLGLSIVKQLIELQNGKIEVDSELNKGTSFLFTLGFKIGSSDSLNNYKTDILDSESDNLDIKILLVEGGTFTRKP